MDRNDVTPSAMTGAGPAALSPAVAALFECGADLDSLERMLLAFAVHPEGAGAARAWWLQWNSRRELLEGWRLAAAPTAAEPLESALARARRAAPAGQSEEVRLRAWSQPPAGLEGALSAAWRGATHAFAPGGDQPGAPWSDVSRVAAVLLRGPERPHALLVIEPAAGASDETTGLRLDALRAFGEAALAAHVRAAEAKTRSRQAAALAEFASACVSSINLAEAMHLLVRLAAQATGSAGAALYRAHDAGEVRLEVAHGAAAMRERYAHAFATAARDAVTSDQPAGAVRPGKAPGLPPDVENEVSASAVFLLAAYERRLGALAVYDGPDRNGALPGFEAHDLEFLAALSAEAALLLAHAGTLADLKRATQREREQAERLRELDRLAGVGELAARVAQEARNPLASIAAFARRAHRALDEGDPQNEYLEIVVRETARLEAMLAEQLQYAQLERPRLRMQALNAVVQQALQRSSETLVRRRVRLLKKLAPDLPSLLLDSPRIQRVVENVLAYALECVSTGGRIQVETRHAGEYVIAEVSFDGQRHGGDLLEQLFVPFAGGGGAAVGLGMAQQIVREHGGEVRVRGESEWSTVFAFTLPVTGNEDRRKSRERRGVRSDRRRRDADAGGDAG